LLAAPSGVRLGRVAERIPVSDRQVDFAAAARRLRRALFQELEAGRPIDAMVHNAHKATAQVGPRSQVWS
jgi:hypothetical protein